MIVAGPIGLRKSAATQIRRLAFPPRRFGNKNAHTSAVHVLLAITLTILVYQFSSTVGMVATVAIVVFVLFNAYVNARLEFGILKAK